MKKILLFYLFLLNTTVCFAQRAIFSAGEITYEYISGDTYRFIVHAYLDCAGGQEPSSISVCFNNPCGNASSFSTLFNKVSTRGNAAKMGCSQHATNCSDPNETLRGYRICYYEALVNLPAKCDSWHIAFAADTTSPNINLQPAKFYIETTLNNQIAPDNSSPFFIEDAVYYGGEGVPAKFNNRAIDPNGDSLAFELIKPITTINNCGSGTVLNKWKPQTPELNDSTNPIQCVNTFKLNNLSGDMTFTGSVAGTSIIVLKTTEYKNGITVGSSIRNQIIYLLPAPISGAPLYLGNNINNLNNCYWTGARLAAYVMDTFSFDFYYSSYDPEAKLMLYDGADTSFPIANITYSNQYSKNPTARVTVAPTIADTGLHYILVKIVDSTCRPPGFIYTFYQTIEIYISSTPLEVLNSKTFNDIMLFPNPNNGQFKIVGANIGIARLDLVNNLGQIVTANIAISNGQVTIPAHISGGMYAIRITSNGKTQTIPFMLNR